MPSDRLTQSDRSEKNESRERSDDASSALSKDVSTQDMRDLVSRRNNSGNDDTMAAFGGLELFASETDENPTQSFAPAADSHINTPTPPPAVESGQFAQRAEALFDRLDSNGDAHLGSDELAAAVQNAQYTGQEAQVVAALYNSRGNLQALSNDEWGFENSGVTRADLQVFAQSQDAATQTQIAAAIARTHESQTNQLNSNLFATPDDPLLSITPDAIVQGNIGDCYLLASISALAATNPQAIRDMIRDNNNGTFTVTFPGDPANPITVNAPTEAERGLYNGGHKYGTWAGVLERAYGQYRGEHGGILSRTLVALESGGNIPTESAGGGGQTSEAMELLTGRSTDFVVPALWSNRDLATRLDQALNSDSPSSVTASINGSLFSSESADGYARRHAYSIIDFQPDGNGSGLITVRNPWGQNNNSTGGTTQITLEQFQANFSDMTFEVPA